MMQCWVATDLTDADIMKLKLTLFALLLSSFAFSAVSKDKEIEQAERRLADKLCEAKGRLAEAVMDNRQQGVSLSKQLSIVPDDEVSKWRRELVISAYKEIRYSTEQMQRKASEDFRSAFELKCYESK